MDKSTYMVHVNGSDFYACANCMNLACDKVPGAYAFKTEYHDCELSYSNCMDSDGYQELRAGTQ